MNRNNKDLYQILKVDKNASLQEINNLVLKTSPKDNPEVGKALMVLTDPQKKLEYDNHGWKDEWEEEYGKELTFRKSIFQAIMDHKKKLNDQEFKTPDDFRVYVFIDEDLDPDLWAPYKGTAAWIDYIWGTFRSRSQNQNWKEELRDFKNKMIRALDEAWRKNKITPLLTGCWEGVRGGNCAKCGKEARLRRIGEFSDGKKYCSRDCYYSRISRIRKQEIGGYKEYSPALEKEKFNCDKCSELTETWTPYRGSDGKKYCSWKCLDEAIFKPLYRNSEPEERKIPFAPDKKSPNKRELFKCVSCHKKTEGNYVSQDQDGNKFHYCSEACRDKGIPKPNNASKIVQELERFLAEKKGIENSEVLEYNRFTGKTTKKKVKLNKSPLLELLNWMKKEGITNISLNSSGNLVIEYGNLTKTVEEDNLTTEQREIKEFFQQNPSIKQSLSQKELEKEVKAMEGTENKGKNGWVVPVVIGMGTIIVILIGVIIYKSKKKGY